MPVLINWKICDNAKECSAFDVCPVGVFTWDEEKKTIVIDNSKCINCGKCKDCCSVGAIYYVKDQEEYDNAKKTIDEDPRTKNDLFVDRYGATRISPAFDIRKGFEAEVLQAPKLVVLELFNNDSIHCLISSVPIKELFPTEDIRYRKEENVEVQKKYDVTELPALLFFKKGKLLGKIEGYFNEKQKDELKEKIKQITG